MPMLPKTETAEEGEGNYGSSGFSNVSARDVQGISLERVHFQFEVRL